MTIGTSTSRVSLSCDGVTTVFPVPLQGYTSADFTAILTAPASAGGGQATLILNSDYTLATSSTDAPPKWTLTTLAVTPFAVGYTLQVFQNPVQTQTSSYVQNQAFPSLAVQTNLDRLTLMVQRLQDEVTRAVHAPDGDVTPLMLLPIASQRVNQTLITDSNGNITTGTSTTSVISIGTVAPIIHYGPTNAETAAGVVPVDQGYPPGDGRRYGMAGDGSTDNTTFLQNALNANAGFTAVRIVKGLSFYKMLARVTVPANSHIVLDEGAELKWTSTTANGTNYLGVASRPGLEVMGDNFLIEGKGKLTGPQTAAVGSGAGGGGVVTAVVNEFGILRVGPSAAARGTGFYVRDVEISLWGRGPVATQYMQDIQVVGCVLHDCAYTGNEHLSGQNGRIHRNKIYGIAPGFSANAYGITLNIDSTNYSSDPNVTAAPRQVANPFCIDFDVAYNEVRDVPLWTGIDAHGGYECHFHHNKVYNCHRGLQLSAGSNAAANYAGENNSITDNDIYASQINGNATTDVSGFQAGIVANGGSVLTHRNVEIARNKLVGVGHASNSPSVYGIESTLVNNLVLADNAFRACVGRHVYMSNSSGSIAGNVFDSIGSSATGSNLLYIDSNCGPMAITGNVHNPLSGTTTPSTNGLNIPNALASRILVQGNDFSACTTAYVNFNGTQTRGNSDITPVISDTTTGSHTIDVSVVGQAPRFVISASQGSAATLTNLLNAQTLGQECKIVMTGGSTLTVNDTGGNIKLQGGTAALTASSALSFTLDINGKWQETGRAIGNS
jgi:hypothetical protein